MCNTKGYSSGEYGKKVFAICIGETNCTANNFDDDNATLQKTKMQIQTNNTRLQIQRTKTTKLQEGIGDDEKNEAHMWMHEPVKT